MIYTIYPNIIDARAAESRGERVLTVRECPECGDELLGAINVEGIPHCEEAQHGTRPGVHFLSGQTIEIEDEQ